MKKYLLIFFIFLGGCATFNEKYYNLMDGKGFKAQGQVTQEYMAKHPNTSPKVMNHILKQEICVGMQKHDVEASWGKPYKINEIVYDGTVKEQWLYANHYVYFYNGEVYVWQKFGY